jgi:hypothetical protein
VALEHALCIVSTALDGASVSVLRSMEELLVPLLVKPENRPEVSPFIADVFRMNCQPLNLRAVELIGVLVPCQSLFMATFSSVVPRLVKLLHVNANSGTLPMRHRIVRLLRHCVTQYKEQMTIVRLLFLFFFR